MTRDDIFSDNSGPDVFVGELTRVEKIGTNRRLIFTMPDAMDPTCRSIVAKLIVPADYMVTLAYMIVGDGVKPDVTEELLSAMPDKTMAN